MSNSVSILSTAELPQQTVTNAAGEGVHIAVIPFIKTVAITNVETQRSVSTQCTQKITALFTSANAVEAVAGSANEQGAAWDVYCIGNATHNEVARLLKSCAIKATAENAAALAEKIVADGVKEAVFFCGDKRLNILPQQLKAAGIALTETEVYRTTATPVKTEQHYDAILFFSPSAAESFFSVNETGKDTVLFAIGNTTANALKQYSSNTVIVSATPSKEAVALAAIQYFHQKAAPMQAGHNQQYK